MRIHPSPAVLALVVLTLLIAGCQRPADLGLIGENSDTTSPGNYTLTLGPENDQREVILHIPPAYEGNSSLPLLIVLHGGGGNAAQIQGHSEMDTDADEFGFVVVYPNGSGRLEDKALTWNAGHCCGYALNNQIDDVGYIDSLIDYFTENYLIDPNRVYLTGISNGGMMAYRAGAELAEKVAGIAADRC